MTGPGRRPQQLRRQLAWFAFWLLLLLLLWRSDADPVQVATTVGADGTRVARLCAAFGLNVLVTRLTALDPTRRGTIMGLNSAVTYLAVFAGTTGFGSIYTAYGFAACCLAALGLTLVAAFAARR